MALLRRDRIQRHVAAAAEAGAGAGTRAARLEEEASMGRRRYAHAVRRNAASKIALVKILSLANGTFTRASEASYPTGPSTIAWASSGVLRSLATLGDDVPGDELAATYLLENAATNLALRSEEFDNATWVKANCTVTANDTTAPDGDADADAVVGTTAGVLTSVSQAALGAAGNVYAFSVWLKKRGTNTNASIRITDGVSPGTLNVTLTSQWTRYQVALTAASAAAVTASIYPHLDTIAGTLGTAGDDLFAWGAQVELVASGAAGTSPAASSYIRTTTAAVTRAADSLTFTAAQVPAAIKNGRFQFAYRANWTGAESAVNRAIYSSSNSAANGLRWNTTETMSMMLASVAQFTSAGPITTRHARNVVVVDMAAAILTVNGTPGSAGTPTDLDPTDTTWRIGGSSVTTLFGRISDFFAA